MFFNEFSAFLDTYVLTPAKMIIAGDFNFHWGETDNIDFKQFKAFLDAHNLFQHVHQPTHNSGNILDLVMTRQDEQVLHSVDVGSLLTDHHDEKLW